MRSIKVQFPNADGHLLAARLEFPVNQKPYFFALFAHCFTCSKNLAAVREISRALNQSGIAVLRLDFTGLGESEGDFPETNFSSNVDDLLAAARFLEHHYQAPGLLVGHSLGGAAVICAAAHLPSARAVATIGAPAGPEHVSHLFGSQVDQISSQGAATVDIGGRPFLVKNQFLEDIRTTNLQQHLRKLRRALLILHAPQDRIVAIENARHLYDAALHPKSFISLDGADHMLSNKNDATYTGEVIACWVKRYISVREKEKLSAEKQVAVRLGAEGFTTEIMVRHHSLTADEPESVGGSDSGPSPYELVTAGLGACTAMTIQMYARRKGWNLREVEVQLEHFKEYADHMADAENPGSKIDTFTRAIRLEGSLDAQQQERLLEIANKCPVHRTLHSEINIITRLQADNEPA